MLARFRSGLTFANVVPLIALFLALGGGAYALTIPRNSVGARQLKHNAVTGSKIRKGAVSSPKVRNRSLLAEDFKAEQLPAGPPGPRGAPGPAGAKGATGATGPPGPTAAATSPGAGNPSGTPNSHFSAAARITTTTTSRLLVTGYVDNAGVVCGNVVCTQSWGLYLDGQPIAGSAESVSQGPNSSTGRLTFTTTAITGPLPGGTYSVSMRDNEINAFNFDANTPRVSVIALGG